MKKRFTLHPVCDLGGVLLRKLALPIIAASLATSAWAQFDITLLSDPPTASDPPLQPVDYVDHVDLVQAPGNPHPGPENVTLRFPDRPGLAPGLTIIGWMENGVVTVPYVPPVPPASYIWPTIFVSGPRTLVLAKAVSQPGTGSPWTDAIIPFAFDPAMSAAHRQIVLEAMDRWAFDTGVHVAFVPWQGDANSPGRSICMIQYVSGTNPNGTSAAGIVGMPTANQANPLKLSLNALNTPVTHEIDHELGHIIALNHTHQRQDRGNHIDIDWLNLPDYRPPDSIASQAMLSQYAIIKDSDWIPGTRTEPYDILSVMHYGNGLNVRAKANEPNAAIFNQFDYIPSIQLSDIKHVRNVYGTNGEARFVDNTGSGGTEEGSLSNPHRSLINGALSNTQRNDSGSRLFVAPGTYSIGNTFTRITGPQKILPYPGGGPVRIVR